MELVESNILQIDSRQFTVSSLGHRFSSLLARTGISNNCRLAVISPVHEHLIEALVGLFRTKRSGLILPAQRATSATLELLNQQGFTTISLEGGSAELKIDPPVLRAEHPTEQTSIYLLTSGTTGQPKLFEHSWHGLTTQRPDGTRKAHHWILTYTAGTYAWYQMLTMLLFCPKQGLLASNSAQPEDVWNCAQNTTATAISSTPSFWRYLLLRRSRQELRDVPLEQISLGGEIVSQDILDELQSLYPTARISHLYASTEAGVGFIVNDGRAGFPTDWLDTRTPGRPFLSVQKDLLWIESPHAAADCGGLFCTGDMVSISGDRAYILGRSDAGILNIGGQKIAAEVVEQALRKHPNIAWCKVYAKKAPIVGALVAADVVLKHSIGSVDQTTWDRELSAHCSSLDIADWAIPRLWQYLENIPLKGNFKS